MDFHRHNPRAFLDALASKGHILRGDVGLNEINANRTEHTVAKTKCALAVVFVKEPVCRLLDRLLAFKVRMGVNYVGLKNDPCDQTLLCLGDWELNVQIHNLTLGQLLAAVVAASG